MPGHRLTVDLPAANGLAAGQTCTFNVPLGRTTHKILFNATNLTLAEITGIRVILNGKLAQTYASGTELNNFNALDGIATAGAGDFSNPLILNFDRVVLRNRDSEELTAIGSGSPDDPNPLTTFQIEVDIDSGATGVTLAAQAVQSAPSQLGLIKLVKKFNYAPAATGVFEISDLPKGDLLQRVMYNTDEISLAVIERDNYTLFDRTQAVNDFMLAADGFRAAVGSKYIIDFGESGFGSNPLVTVSQDLRFKLTMSGTTAFTGVYEFIGPLGR